MNKYSEYDYVQKCLRKIEEQIGWGDSKFWHNDVFQELSDKIQEQTQVLLSSTTLKRVWGRVNYTNAPSITTLNTLAQFAGYANWRDFKNQQQKVKQSPIFSRVTANMNIILVSAALMTLLFLSLYSAVWNANIEPPDYSNIEFKSTSITNGLPNSVVFDFNLPGITSDSIYIQQYWDPTKTIKISKDQEQATGQYYFPGYFRAKLLIDGQIIREHDLFIKSDGWLGTIDYEPIPKYIKNHEITTNGLSFSVPIINEIKSSDVPLISSFHYVNNLGKVSGDNFEFNTSIKNIYSDKWAVCEASEIIIVGTKSAFVIPFSIPGCVSEIGVMLSESYLSGKKHDLSFFGIDLKEFRDIKITSHNKEINVFVDQEKIFTSHYIQSIGDIVGIRYRFLGAGEVASLELLNANNRVVVSK